MQTHIAGPHPDQMTALRPALEYRAEYPDIRDWRIAYSPDQGWAAIDPEVRRNTEAAARLLEEQGATVEEVELPWDGQEIQDATLKALLSSAMGSMLLGISQLNRADDLTSYARYFAGLVGGECGPTQLVEAQNHAALMHAQYDALFEQGYRAFICPTVTTGHVEADFDFTSQSLTVDGQEVDPLGGALLTAAFNLLCTIPVVNVPTGLDGNRVPTGMQITTRAFDDLAAFQFAAAYSKAAPEVLRGRADAGLPRRALSVM